MSAHKRQTNVPIIEARSSERPTQPQQAHTRGRGSNSGAPPGLPPSPRLRRISIRGRGGAPGSAPPPPRGAGPRTGFRLRPIPLPTPAGSPRSRAPLSPPRSSSPSVRQPGPTAGPELQAASPRRDTARERAATRPQRPRAVPRLRSRGTFSSPLSLRPAGTGTVSGESVRRAARKKPREDRKRR